ncbi:flavin-containing monooxygenase [Williamsia muralis]|uniref:NAD(P)/FAD-dependent oxidoreductase n=1 Tax=Williamsia marianensis TaxID=85044 RepID=A0ABU4EVR9_WILMA|nr:NAD(P)/FAD-dependent oxidoreductase [Williamsia muralis]MDV7134051.1 NAD(P)/FAD-dependent oxidoreductase [Williamsia muralis]
MTALSSDAIEQHDLPASVHTLIVGTGFAGLAAAHKILADTPSADVLIIERASDVGGTWRDNTYPGAACDVPSNLYSFSFAQSPEWTHNYARQPEIFAYLRSVAEQRGLRDRTVFECELLGARWDADKARWSVSTSRGQLEAQVLIAATGTLSNPSFPDVPGIGEFTGTMFHSATWNHDFDPAGKRIAVVGTGASAIQFVPELAGPAAHVTVFQRTPAWIIPRLDRQIGKFERTLYRLAPFTQRFARNSLYFYREAYVVALAKFTFLLPLFKLLAMSQLRKQVKDPGLRKKLTPKFTIGCKRMLLSNTWLSTLAREDVTLVDTGMAAVTANGVVDGAGREHEVDAIVFGTGFTATEPPVASVLYGEDGRTLADTWNGSPNAYRGTTVHGFPNLFLMYGPNTNLGHSSIVFMLESQAAYISSAITQMRSRNIASVNVNKRKQTEYNQGIDEQLEGTVWNSGGCSSWYFDKNGRNSVMWPTFTWEFRQALRSADLSDYDLGRGTVPAPRPRESEPA